jgi:hypothetical protein
MDLIKFNTRSWFCLSGEGFMHNKQKKSSRKGGLNDVEIDFNEIQAASFTRLRRRREKPKAAPAPKRGSGPGTVLVELLVLIVEVTD